MIKRLVQITTHITGEASGTGAGFEITAGAGLEITAGVGATAAVEAGGGVGAGAGADEACLNIVRGLTCPENIRVEKHFQVQISSQKIPVQLMSQSNS